MALTDTINDQFPTLTPELSVDPTTSRPFDVYQNVHKGIRAELCSVIVSAGNTDPADRTGRAALVNHVHDVVELLELHAEKENNFVHPILEVHVPAVVERLEADHGALEARLARVAERADESVECAAAEQRARMHNLYLDLSSFTSAYLAHQELEERIAMPALLDAVGIEGAMDIEHRLVGSIPPPLLAKGLSVMVPAMNIDDRADFLGGMQRGAPPEAFANVWNLVQSVLAPSDVRQLAARLNLGYPLAALTGSVAV